MTITIEEFMSTLNITGTGAIATSGISYSPSYLSETQLFAQYLNNNPLVKEGFKAMFSGYIREEFVKQTESGKEITNEDLRNIADEAAKKFTEYLCNL